MPKKHDSNVNDMIKKYQLSLQCAKNNCVKEGEALTLRQQQYVNSISKLMHDVSLKPDVRNKRLQKLATDFNTSIQKRNDIDCKLKHCYDESIELIKAKIATAKHIAKPPAWTKIYTKALEKGKITRNDIIKANAIILNTQIQKGIDASKSVMNNLFEVQSCTKKHCGALKKKVESQKLKYKTELKKIHADTKMSPIEKKKKLEELTIQFFDSPERNKMLDCELGQCREETERTISESIKLAKTVPNPPKYLAMSIKVLENMLKNKRLTKENIIKNDIKLMKLTEYKAFA